MNKKNIIFWVIVLLFIATSVVTLLGVCGALTIKDAYLGPLVAAFLIELSAVVLTLFKKTDFLTEQNLTNIVPAEPAIEASKRATYNVNKLRNRIEISSTRNDANESLVSISIGDVISERYNDAKCLALPVNSSFHDDCIKRRNSSTGAYVTAHLKDDPEKVYQLIYSEFSRATKAIGQIVSMKNFLNSDNNIIFISVTTKSQEGLIATNPINISFASQELVRFGRTNDVAHIYCPIFGSGDGGVPVIIALRAMIEGFFSAFQMYKCNKMTVHIIAHKSNFASLEKLHASIRDQICS